MLAFGVGTQEGWAGAPRAPRSPGTSRDQISILCCPVTSEPTRAGAAQTSRKFCRPKTQSSVYAGFCSGGSGHCFSDLPAPYRLESRPLSQCVNAAPRPGWGPRGGRGDGDGDWGESGQEKGRWQRPVLFRSSILSRSIESPFLYPILCWREAGLGERGSQNLNPQLSPGKGTDTSLSCPRWSG